MKTGDLVRCTGSRGYAFTTGKEYVVLEFMPAVPEPGIGFTWPAYVRVMDDDGKPAVCHASRFVAVETAGGAA